MRRKKRKAKPLSQIVCRFATVSQLSKSRRVTTPAFKTSCDFSFLFTSFKSMIYKHSNVMAINMQDNCLIKAAN